MAPAKLAASILSADFAYLADQVRLVEKHADMVHVDVMDAHFVPSLTIGPVVVASLRPVTDLPLHAHLMIERPEALFDDFASAGTDIVTFHVEAAADPAAVVASAEERGMRAGIAVNPETGVDVLYPFLEALDNVIVMTLERTGFAGQPFQDSSLRKIEAVRGEIDRRGLAVEVIVDGGINEESGRRCIAAGATVLAAASSIFKAADPAEAARRLAELARAEGG
ncbi:MAG TPA: ribulose-phosphate 3-epimerase [Actinomycetota bacterium]|jgi:ribulose-phosphate 3-epimerase|nr:ribulose-phosphate 3-epimerase [Actinomycetota bacterium]